MWHTKYIFHVKSNFPSQQQYFVYSLLRSGGPGPLNQSPAPSSCLLLPPPFYGLHGGRRKPSSDHAFTSLSSHIPSRSGASEVCLLMEQREDRTCNLPRGTEKTSRGQRLPVRGYWQVCVWVCDLYVCSPVPLRPVLVAGVGNVRHLLLHWQSEEDLVQCLPCHLQLKGGARDGNTGSSSFYQGTHFS